MRTKQFSKVCFYNALEELCRECPYEEVQISQICQKAGFNRSTFYRSYRMKEDILKEKMRELIVQYNGLRKTKNADDFQSIVLLFSFYRESSMAINLIHQARLDDMLRKLGMQNFPAESEHSANDYEKIFITSGFLAVILRWLSTGMKESAEYMAEHIDKVFRQYGL